MELYQLRSFAAVAELGHLTRAADKLHVSQPAVSAQIKALEDELGVALFERVSSGMVLTAAGHKLLPEARKVVAAAQVLRSRARAIQGEIVGRVRVGTVSDPDFVRVGDFLAHALQAHPLLEIELHHEVSGVAFQKVRDGVHDASFYYGSVAHPDVASIPLVEFAYRVVGPAAWRAQIETATWDDIVAMPWIMTPPISSLHVLAAELFDARGVSPARRIEADNEAVIRSLVDAGLGVALMREDLALEAAEKDQVAVWEEARLGTTLQFIYMDERAQDPEIRALLDVLSGVWSSVPAGLRATA
jgi:DNA-binding transcriptional LysR family regulator